MTTRDFWNMRSWQRTLVVLRLQLDTVASGLWKRRTPGFWGMLEAWWSTIKYGFLVLFCQVSWGIRVRIIASLYSWLRRVVDDRVDSLSDSTAGIGTRSYFEAKQELVLYSAQLETMRLPVLTEDALLIDALRCARALGLDFTPALKRLWELFTVDVKRLRSFAAAPRNELLRHAVEQDQAILVPCVAILGGDSLEAERAIEKLHGIFTRIDCLSDLIADLQDGAINIPSEEIHEFNINIAQLRRCRSWNEARRVLGFPEWYRRETEALVQEWGAAKSVIRALMEGLDTGVARHPLRQRVASAMLANLLGLFDDLLTSCISRFAVG